MGCGCEDNTTLTTGIDGYNAFTITTASYVQPAVNTNVTVSVSNNGQYTGVWAIPDQTIFIDDGGYYIVVSATATSLTIKYQTDYATFNQSLTAAAGTVATNRKVSPAGKKGEDGSTGEIILDSYVNTTGVGNDAAAGESTLRTYTLLANELTANGDYLDIDAYFTYNKQALARTNVMIMRLKLGGSTIFTWEELSAIDLNISLNIKISRISSTSQLWVINKNTSDSSYLYSNVLVGEPTSAADLTVNNDFLITADNGLATANQIILKKCVINKISI